MPELNLENIIEMISSENKEKILEGLKTVEKNIRNINPEDVQDIISALFYIDLGDHPEMIDIKDKATKVLSLFGEAIIPFCIKSLSETDLKAALDFARVLGYIGKDAVDSLIESYYKIESPEVKTFILYAMSKIKDKEITKALPLIIAELSSQNDEVRDTATRTIGKLFENIESNEIDKNLLEIIFHSLINRATDNKAPIRAKALRSLGKIAKLKILPENHKKQLEKICKRALGEEESFEADRYFLVRKEAKETLKYL